MKKGINFLLPLSVIALLLFSSFSYNEWNTAYNEDGIAIRYREADCKLETGSNQRWFLIQIQNTANDSKIVEWDLELFDQNGKGFRCNNTAESHRIVKVTGGETIEGICSIKTQNELKLAEKMLDIKTVNEVKEVKIKNVTVKNLD